MKKLKIEEIIVVEGKDDVANLSQIIDGTIISINGASGLSIDVINKLKNISINNKILLLTDPDFTGKKIREKISENIDNVEHIFVSRNISNKNGNIGVENISKENLYNIFLEYIKTKNNFNNKSNYTYTINDILEYGLSGKFDSKYKRERLGDILKIGYYNSQKLIKVLNGMKLEYDKFVEANKKISKFGIIFGKFIPVHKGHLHFIEEASKKVDKLYIILCVDKERDLNLLKNSTLPKFITEEDRYILLKENLKNINNIQIEILREEGIKSYPNGWEEWSNRVVELLEEKNIYITTVFTNEIEDKNNYIKYFSNTKVFSSSIEIILNDPNRKFINISATKIRQDFNKYSKFLPNNVQDFFYS